MQRPSRTAPLPLRILVVDDEEQIRAQHAELLRQWGYTPIIADGQGRRLLDDARMKARTGRCQIALIDMRLLDSGDRGDRSGLKLAQELAPMTASIIVSGINDRAAAVAALRVYGAHDFVGKEDDLSEIRRAIEDVARKLVIGSHRAPIGWTTLSSASVRSLLFPDRPDIPDDEADELIGRMFPDAPDVTLKLLQPKGEPSALAHAPDAARGRRQLPSEELISTLRRESRVFTATVDGLPALFVVKIARTDKIANEVANYNAYVKNGTVELYRVELVNSALLWDMGAAVYRHAGGAAGAQGALRTFTEAYQHAAEEASIIAPLQHFFNDRNWGRWYNQSEPLETSLFDAYDAVWRGALSAARPTWRNHYDTMMFPGIAGRLPHPHRWLYSNLTASAEVKTGRRAVTHGDLHGDNLFVNQAHAWPLDFERTGPGPILRDIVELIQDITTRLAQFSEGELPMFYSLAVVICVPTATDENIVASPAILAHPEARKAFTVVQELLRIAHTRTRYSDRRELLWALLFNHMFVAARLREGSPWWLRTMLFASVICSRLDAWESLSWPPADWPKPAFDADSSSPASDAPALRRAALVQQLEALKAEYRTVSQQIIATIDAGAALRLRRQQDNLLHQIEETERAIREGGGGEAGGHDA